MKLSDWAKQQGISYKTAWRWFKNGTRLYGRRSAKNKAKKAIEAIKCEEVVSEW